MARKNDNSSIEIALKVLLIGVTCYSTYQTFLGCLLDFNGNKYQAAFFAGLLGFTLIISAIMFSNYTKNGDLRANSAKYVYFFAALLTFITNYNAFYTEAAKKNILYKNLESLDADLTSLKSKSLNYLQSFNGYNSLKSQIEDKKVTLKYEILDTNSGLGTKAKVILREIEKILGLKLTEPTGTPQYIASQLEKQIDDVLSSKFASESKSNTNQILKEINIDCDSINYLINTAKQNDDFNYSKTVIEQGIKIHNKICEKIKSQDKDDKFKFKCENKTFSNKEVGKISYSISALFTNFGETIMALIRALFTDFIVPFLFTVYYRPKNSNPLDNDGFPTRGNDENDDDY